ncbi:MAG: hypothetical protein K2X32_00155, partial [Phycisphaerales bacterium]|nr:hypothetical protein [Phycisphaerales bacterium]
AGLESDIRNSQTTIVSRNSSLSADAIESGHGGAIAIWSNDWTWFAGSLSATGAGTGNGGFAEISSANQLGFYSTDINLRGGQPDTFGTLLLDPNVLTISDIPITTGTLDANLPTILAGTGGPNETVSYLSVNAALLNTSVVLEAATSIVFDTIGGGTFTFSNLVSPNTLTLRTTGAAGSISFTTTTNTISAANVSGGNFVFTNGVGTGGLSLGNVSTTGGNITLTTAGPASITSASLNAGTFTSTGTTFAGAVTATGAAPINITHTGNVTVNGAGLTTVGGNISVSGINYSQAAGNLRTGAANPAAAGNILLNMTGTVAFSGGGTVSGANLRVASVGGTTMTGAVNATNAAFVNATAGNIVVNGAGSLGTIAANNSFAGGSVEIAGSNAAGMTVGTVALLAGFNGGVAVSGLTANVGPITLVNSGGALSLTQAVNAGAGAAGIVRLSAASGGVAQSGSGIITANTLAARNLATSGNIDLSLANAVSNVALANSFATGTVGFNSNQSLVVTSVPAAALTVPFAGATAGVTTAGFGSILLTVGGSGQTLTLNQAVNNGTNAASIVRLGATGTITQDAVGLITTNTLGVVSIGAASNNILLTEGNTFRTLAGRIQANARQFRVRSVSPITIGSVTALPGFNAGAALTGVQIGANGDVLISSGGAGTALTINEQISAAGGTVRLVSTSGIGQGANGLITASSLGLTNTVGDVLLDVAGVSITGLAASNTAANAEIIILDTDGITVTDVTGIAALFNGGATLSGVSTNNGNITIVTNDSTPGAGAAILTIDSAIAAGTGTVRLSAQGGIDQNAGTITAANLGLVNTDFDDIIVDNVGNAIGSVSSRNTAFGVTNIRDSNGLIVASLDNAAYAIFNGGAAINGVVAGATQTINLVSGAGGALTLNQPVNATATGTVRLSSQGGIGQAAAGVITAQNLGVLNATAGNVDLTTATNAVSTFAARNDFATGTFALGSNAGLTLGTIAAGPAFFNGGLALAGLTTTGNGDAFLLNTSTTAPINLTTATNLSGGIFRLQSSGGIAQTATGGIAATALAALNTTAGDIALTLGTNAILGLAASNTFATGTIGYTDTNGLGIALVGGGPAGFNAGADLSGVTTNAGDVLITSGPGGALFVGAAINVGNANTVRLSSQGGVTQDGTGI